MTAEPTWSTGAYDRFVRFGSIWLRVSAVDAVEVSASGKTRVALRGGQMVTLGTIPPTDVARRLWQEGQTDDC